MRQADFNILASEEAHDVIATACNILQREIITGNYYLVYCQDKNQAEELDESLWQIDPKAFIAHKISGEGPNGATQVEISYPDNISNSYRQLLNISQQHLRIFKNFNKIIEIIPNQASDLEKARDRYRTYKQNGFTLIYNDLRNKG